MPYKSLDEINPALKGIKPKITLEQANKIAAHADAIGGDYGWPTAIKSFKRTHTVRNRRWVERKKDMSKEKQIETIKPVEENQPEVQEMGYPDYYIPTDVVSFAQLRIQQETAEIADSMKDLTEQFTSLLWNIINGMVVDKIGAVRTLVDEFIGELDSVLVMPAETAETGGGDPISETPAEEVITALAESFEGAVVLQEDSGTPDVAYLDLQIIRPGWGNSRDNNYYPREMLERDSQVFKGAKMYETDHRDDEKSTRTWVSTIQEIKGFTDDGAPVARVAVHDPSFAERVRNLNSAGLLEKMECSILANGKARGGYESGGRKGKIVEAITEVSSVDWVTKAGAGGKVLNLAESETPPEVEPVQETSTDDEPIIEVLQTEAESDIVITERDTQPVETEELMEDAQIRAILTASRLPVVSQERLLKNMYRDQSELRTAIANEKDYIKTISGSGKPFGLSESETPAPKPVDFEEIARRKDEVNQKHLRLGGNNA